MHINRCREIDATRNYYGIIEHSHVSFEFHVSHPPFDFTCLGLCGGGGGSLLGGFRFTHQTDGVTTGGGKFVRFLNHFLTGI